MSQIPRETIEQVLAATDIVSVIGSYIPLRRAGARFLALCPFHNENTPSLSIDPARQFFHCFGCQKSGDAIGFVRDYEGLPFTDAVRKLAERAGIAIVERAPDPREEADRRRRGQLLDLHRKLATHYHELLLSAPEAEHARQYLDSRGLSHETILKWQIGWAPPREDFIAWARQQQITGRDLVDGGVAKSGTGRGLYFYFRNRLMFPIANSYGDVIGFSGRQLEENPREGKYVNSPETRLFKKSTVLFGLNHARKGILEEQFALLCEGQIDVIICHEHGIFNAIAPLGTAFPEHHASTLRRYAKTAVLCYDSDTAGRKAAESVFQILAAHGIAAKIMSLPEKEDPDSYIRTRGIDTFRQLIKEAGNLVDFRIGHASLNLDDPIEKARFAEETAALLALIKDTAQREALVQHLATRLQLGAPAIQIAVNRARRAAQKKPRRPAHQGAPEDAPTPAAAPAPLDKRVAELCSLALHSPAVGDRLGEQLEIIQELLPHLAGIDILLKILSDRPASDSPAAVNACLASLPVADQASLHAEPAFLTPLPENPVQTAEITLAEATVLALELEDAKLKATLADPTLGIEQQIPLLQRVKELAELMSELPGRALHHDRILTTPAPSRVRRNKNKKGGNTP